MNWEDNISRLIEWAIYLFLCLADYILRSILLLTRSMQQQMTSLMEQDERNGNSGHDGAFASFMAPLKVTSRVKSQIRALPRAEPSSPNDIVLVHTITEQEYEGTSMTCNVYQVKKEHGSNGLSYPDGDDGLGVVLAMCAVLDPTNSTSNRPAVILGTIAKACLSPNSMGTMSVLGVRPCRPRKVLLATQGELDMLEPDLRSIGITEMGVAEQSLIRSLEIHSSVMNDAQYDVRSDPMGGPQAMGHAIMAQTQARYEPYVDEEPVSLGRWRPPTEEGDFPARWFARPPNDPFSYRPTALCGWRTNLERAILREDTAKVNEIVNKYNAADIREYVECRMLLTKCAQRGLITACKLLIDKCGASTEGAQAPDSESWWLEVQDASGNCDSLTPLQQAARNGQVESVKLLLDKGAEIDRIDKSNLRATALHHAISGRQTECCQVLCERGANLRYKGSGGDALGISEMLADQDKFSERVQEKMQQILREFDSRCSACRAPNPAKTCPCRKERYCDAACQKERWRKHKEYHRKVVGS